jgi:hypothetical protein
MIRPFRIALAILGTLFSACNLASAANPPKVVFIGDYITANWPVPANSNWVNMGVNQISYCCVSSGSSGYWIDNLQQVINQHPDVVHIMVGAEDAAFADDGTLPLVNSIFVLNIEQIVTQLQAAGIKVILGTEIPSAPSQLGMTEMNGFVLQYGAAKGLPVVNYSNALYGYQNGAYYPPVMNSNPTSYQPQGYVTTNTTLFPEVPLPIPSAAGYALMTQMAQTAIATLEGAKLQSGWLENIGFGMGRSSDFPTPVFNQNAVAPGWALQFTPDGTYSDGVTRQILTSNITGASGTWTSNNPAVMYVNQYGYAEALSPGTAWIFYTSPEGVTFSPWVMTVGSSIP